MDYLISFAFYYPLIMSYVWMIGGAYYYFHWERQDNYYYDPPPLPEYPPVSILLPCYNEGENLYETVAWLFQLNYPNYEVIAINDGSSDNTGEILDELQLKYDKFRVIHFAANQGKAMGLRMGALFSPNEILICIDGDALLDANAIHWMVRHFLSGPRVGAVTGNPRIRNRSTLLGKIQVGEFTSIIGLIKRAQRIYGRIFAASGVIVGFRKTALHHVDYWSIDMVTEDIDICWKLQLGHWDLRYEPNALCWILMPETLNGLWKQRLRWAQGGCEVGLKYFRVLWHWTNRRMWPIYLELVVSIVWAYIMSTIFILWFVGKFITLPQGMAIETLFPGWSGALLGFTCLAQFAVSFAIDRRYEPKNSKYYYWMVWYPIAFWLIGMLTTVVSFFKAVTKKQGKRAVWVSPDRGIRDTTQN